MDPEQVEIDAPVSAAPAALIRYGHWGRPLLGFADLVAAGRVKIYCVDSYGHDVAHDWPWWQRRLAHHLPRVC